MCKRNRLIGNILMAFGVGLLISMLVPRNFWTIVCAGLLIGVGYIICMRGSNW